MTVTTTTNRNDYVGDGVTATFPFTWTITDKSEVVASTVNAGTVTTLSLGSGFTIPDSDVGRPGGGNVTIVAGAPASGVLIALRRVDPITQTVSLPATPAQVEAGFDKLTKIAQQQQDQLSRSLTLNPALSPAGYNLNLPIPAAGQGIRWNNLGNALEAFDPGSVPLAVPGDGTVTNAKVAAGSIAQDRMASITQGILGSPTGGTSPTVLTPAQAAANVATMVASGGSHAAGLVPDPGGVAGTSRFLREDATWAAVDMLSARAQAEITINGATTLTGTAFGRWHVCVDAGTPADYTVLLPPVSGNGGKFIALRMDSSLTKLVTIAGNALGEKIDGFTSRVLWYNELAVLYCTGSAWIKIAGKSRSMSAACSQLNAQSIPDSTPTKLVLDGTAYTAGISDFLDTGNNWFMPRRTGAYQVSISVGLAAGTVATRFYVRTNSSPASASPVFAEMAIPNTATTPWLTTSAVIALGAGTPVWVEVFHNTGGARNTALPNAVGTINARAYFSIIEIPVW
jgi:hypothetical protein